MFPAQKQRIVLGGELPDSNHRRWDRMWKNHTNSSGLYSSRFSCVPWTLNHLNASGFNKIQMFLRRICTKRKKPQCSPMQQLNRVLQPAYSPLCINTTFKICFVFSFEFRTNGPKLFCFMPGLLYSFIESISFPRRSCSHCVPCPFDVPLLSTSWRLAGQRRDESSEWHSPAASQPFL